MTIGTTFSFKAVTADFIEGGDRRCRIASSPTISLTREARHVAFLPGGHALIVLRGEIQHKIFGSSTWTQEPKVN